MNSSTSSTSILALSVPRPNENLPDWTNQETFDFLNPILLDLFPEQLLDLPADPDFLHALADHIANSFKHFGHNHQLRTIFIYGGLTRLLPYFGVV